jgi:hypothetical protein
MRFVVLAFMVAACTTTASPTPTETVCPDPDPDLTWDNFGQKFMTTYCTMCHSSTLPHALRNGAPYAHDYDTLRTVLYIPDHIDQDAGSGPAAHNTRMPPSRCPSTPGGPIDRDCATPTDEERTNLSIWLACEVKRPHMF